MYKVGGMSPTRKSTCFVSFLCASVRAAWLPNGIRDHREGRSLPVLLLPAELSLFPPPTPKPPIQL